VIAIENVRLFEAEQQRTRELSEALEQQGAQWLAIKSAALDAVIANGGTAGCLPARCRASRSRSPWISPAASRSEPMRVRQRFGDGRELGEQRHGIATPWKSRCIATMQLL
jgi:hypothetical protein